MRIEQTNHDNRTRLTLKGAITGNSAKQLTECTEELVRKNLCVLELDLEAVAMVDSAGLEALLTCREQCADAGGSLTLVNLNKKVARILKVTRLDRELAIQS